MEGTELNFSSYMYGPNYYAVVAQNQTHVSKLSNNVVASMNFIGYDVSHSSFKVQATMVVEEEIFPVSF